jgi:hypothetical protein
LTIQGVPNLSTSMPQVLAQEVGCGGMVIVPPGSQGLKHTLRLLHGFVVQRTGYRFRVYVISSIFISLPPW